MNKNLSISLIGFLIKVLTTQIEGQAFLSSLRVLIRNSVLWWN